MTSFWIENFIGTILIAVILAGIIIPQILLVAFRKNLFDDQDSRKIHKGSVPRLGGFAFLPSILFSISAVCGLNFLYPTADFHGVFSLAPQVIPFVICALMLTFLTGMADDLIGVRYKAKFVVQIIVACFLILGGANFTNLNGVLFMTQIPNWLGCLFAVLLIVYLINAINLIDGIDGLASGLSMIAMVYYAVIYALAGKYLFSLLAVATFGTLLPFFYYNFFGDALKKTKIFMGDTGSLTIGVIIAFLALSMTDSDGLDRLEGYNPVICAFAPVIVPAFDVVRVYLHRVLRHRNPFMPDRCHIHHKLLAFGLTTRRALGCILLVAIAFLCVNFFLSPYVNPNILVFGDIVVWTGGHAILSHCIRRRERRTGTPLYD